MLLFCVGLSREPFMDDTRTTLADAFTKFGKAEGAEEEANLEHRCEAEGGAGYVRKANGGKRE
jgi:hypothetical protein